MGKDTVEEIKGHTHFEENIDANKDCFCWWKRRLDAEDIKHDLIIMEDKRLTRLAASPRMSDNT